VPHETIVEIGREVPLSRSSGYRELEWINRAG